MSMRKYVRGVLGLSVDDDESPPDAAELRAIHVVWKQVDAYAALLRHPSVPARTQDEAAKSLAKMARDRGYELRRMNRG